MLLFALIAPALGTTWTVDPSGSGDATTLAEGFALLSDGDTLLVVAGDYAEGGIETTASEITVLGEGLGVTVIDGSGVPGGDGLLVGDGGAAAGTSVLSGLTFRHFSGAAITADTHISLSDCSFEGDGAGVESVGWDLLLADSLFRGNEVGVYIPGAVGGLIVIENTLFEGNTYGIGDPDYTYGRATGDWTLAGNTFVGGDTAVYVHTGSEYGGELSLTVVDNVFVGLDWAWRFGGSRASSQLHAYLLDNVLASSVGTYLYYRAPTEVLESATLSADPIFVSWSDDGDYTNDDLHLAAGSPGIDYGLDGYVTDDYDGLARPIDGDLDGTATPDCGAYEYNPDADGDGYYATDAGGDDCDDTDASSYPVDWYADVDRDGFGDPASSAYDCAPAGYVLDSTDCDDSTATSSPTSPEICDGLDNNCDGAVDEGVLSTFYADSDGDGFGDPAVTVAACPDSDGSAPDGYVADSTDCDDTNATVSPALGELCDGLDNNCEGSVDEGVLSAFYADSDGDGFGDPAVTVSACPDADGLGPAGYVADTTDCDDTNASMSPALAEVCDGLDNDCNGLVDDGATDAPTWYQDADSDTYGDLSVALAACPDADGLGPAGYVADATDCDDTDAAWHPGAPEVCTDPNDYNCDGSVTFADADGDGWAACVECDDSNAATNPAAAETCNGTDDNCDGLVDEGLLVTFYADSDGDTYGDPAVFADACPAPDGSAPDGYVSDDTDCDDAAAATWPGAPETCGDGVDQDCDGADLACAVDTDTGTGDTGTGDTDTGTGDTDTGAPDTDTDTDADTDTDTDTDADADADTDADADADTDGDSVTPAPDCGCATSGPTGISAAWGGVALLLVARRRRRN